MRLHRFIGEFNLNKDFVEIKDLELIKQIKSVLRLGIGDFLILCDGLGTEARVEITQIEKGKITIKIIEITKREDNFKKVSLYLAILKKENFELAIEKAVEIGINEIIPIITTRTVKTGLNIDRLNKIIREASEQSGRLYLPKLSPIMKFEDAILDGSKNEEKKFFTLLVSPQSITINGVKTDGVDIVDIKEGARGSEASARKNSASIFIGPEGGFTEEENNFAKENNYEIESLGENTLRAETAAIVASYKIVNNL